MVDPQGGAPAGGDEEGAVALPTEPEVEAPATQSSTQGSISPKKKSKAGKKIVENVISSNQMADFLEPKQVANVPTCVMPFLLVSFS